MRYRRFETLVLTVGAAAIVGSVFFSLDGVPVAQEVVAQMLLLAVLIAAVHWGRKGGFFAATLASIIYILMRIPLLLDLPNLTVDAASLLLVRILTYGLVGIVGGELCGRIRYVFARLESSNSIDDWSQVYNQGIIARTLESAVNQFTRYDTPFSVVTIELASPLFSDLRTSKQRALVRAVASYVRNDIRLVDELGRLDDGRFIVVLPHTPREGATVAAERLRDGVCDTLGAKQESVRIETLATPDDLETLNGLQQSLAAPRSASA
jgi:GGDEF domain-containing protein